MFCRKFVAPTEAHKLFVWYQLIALFFISLDFSGMLQGKIQVGYSSTAENTAARKAFLVRFRFLFCSAFFSFFSFYLVRRVERDRLVKEFGGYNSVFKYTYEKFTILFSCVTTCHQPSLCVISHNNKELNINEQPWADPGKVTWVRIHPPPPFREVKSCLLLIL